MKNASTFLIKLILFLLGLIPTLSILPARADGQWIFCVYDEPKRIAWLIFSLLLMAVVISVNLNNEVFWRKLRKMFLLPTTILLYCFVFWGFISSFWALVPHASMYEFIQYLVIAILFPILLIVFNDFVFLSSFLSGLVIGWIAVSLVGLAQIFSPTGPLIGIGGANGSFFGARNSAALGLVQQIFLFIGIAFYYVRNGRVFLSILTTLILLIEIVYLITLGSRTAYVSFFLTLLIGISLFFIFKFSLKSMSIKQLLQLGLVFTVILTVIIGVFWTSSWARERGRLALIYFKNPKRYFSSERWVFFRNSIEIIRKHPLLGIGLGNWCFVYPIYRKIGKEIYFTDYIQVRRAHCDYIQLFSEVGTLGFIFWLIPILNILKSLNWSFSDLSPVSTFVALQILAFIFLMLFDYPLQMPYHKFLFYYTLSIGGAISES